MVFFFWIMLQVHGSFENLEEKEIEEQTLTGSDFTFMIKNLPDYDDNILLKAKLWKKIEDVLEERREGDLKKQFGLRMDDTEDGKIADIRFGMSDYSFFQFYKKRANFARDKKVLMLKKMILKRMSNPDVK
jgi:hypothetical protein